MLILVKIFVLTYNALMPLEDKIIHNLRKNNYSLSTAESCTGGLLSHRLTQIPGSSATFKGGIIAYSNEIKINILKVPEKMIRTYGAVSAEVAITLAKSVRTILKTDFGISITGIAGPTGATFKKPVGLVFIAVATNKETLCLKCQFDGSRSEIKSKASTQALKILQEFL